MAYINGKQVLFSARVNGLVNVDNELSGVSTNPAENQAVANAVGNALKGTLSGAAVRADGVSPIQHSPVVKVSNKNLVNIDAVVNNVFVKNADGSYTITKADQSNRFSGVYDLSIPANTAFTISFVEIERSSEDVLSIRLFKSSGEESYVQISESARTLTITDDIVRIQLYMQSNETDGAYITFRNFQIELGDTATEYAPYIDPASVTPTRCGKNLLNPIGEDATKNGVTFTNNGDGTFTVKGTSTGPAGFDLTKLTESPLHLSKGETYTQSVIVLAGDLGGATIVPSVKDSDGNVKYNYFSNNTTKTADNDYSFYTYTLYIDKAETIDATFKVQLEIGSTTTDYEAYTAETYTPNADGTVEGVTSLSPCMSFITDTAGAIIEVEYNKDSNAVIGDVEAAADAIIAIQESLIGGASV